jgi:gluconate kinase
VTDAARLHAAADESNDAADHDELHAAGAVTQMLAGEPYNPEYVQRWLAGLAERIR